ncbi:hypothetical protein [Brevibacterium sp. FME37]|uniref:hypothetical protein n=1 Tax=Brevibacterium sp. FME37 TaxID=2742607 RepID=UPI0018671B4D|nr:hypothetical protein [Brevibacterium sp. FME37]
MFNTALKPATASAPVKKILTMFTIASLLALVLGLATTMANPSPAQAAPKVSVSGTPKADGEFSLDLSGSGFQSVKNGFGGVYVLFGWVDDPGGSWRPSKGGATGTNYRYVYDDETNPTGYQVFVTFPGSSTAEAANGGELASNGAWNATIRIPGSKFTTYDRSQNETQVDCTEVQCGIITIGAHGVTNANNESFTPVDFSAAGAAGGGDSKNKDSGDDGKKDESAKQHDAETTDAETTDTETTAGKDAETAAAAGGSDAVSPVDTSNQTPVVAPVASEPPMSTSWLIFFAILAGVLVLGSIIAIGLGFGIGGYLAVKSLLLGVSPAAMEKERDRREKKRIKTKHKLQKRRIKMQRRKKLKLAKLERGSERAVAQSTHQGAGTGKLPPQVIAFFQDEKKGDGDAARGWTDPTGGAPAHAATEPAEERDTRVLSSVPADNTETTTLPTTKS